VSLASTALSLDEAGSLLHLVRDLRNVDITSRHLSRGQVTLTQLQGGPDSMGVPRSMSTLMLCNQAIEILEQSARSLSRTEELQRWPCGAAAAIDDVLSIKVDAVAAFSILPEEEEGLPGHVSIRFTAMASSLSETDQRDLRDRLIRAFGETAPVDELRAVRC
jgi:hypothetical protein